MLYMPFAEKEFAMTKDSTMTTGRAAKFSRQEGGVFKGEENS